MYVHLSATLLVVNLFVLCVCVCSQSVVGICIAMRKKTIGKNNQYTNDVQIAHRDREAKTESNKLKLNEIYKRYKICTYYSPRVHIRMYFGK